MVTWQLCVAKHGTGIAPAGLGEYARLASRNMDPVFLKVRILVWISLKGFNPNTIRTSGSRTTDPDSKSTENINYNFFY